MNTLQEHIRQQVEHSPLRDMYTQQPWWPQLDHLSEEALQRLQGILSAEEKELHIMLKDLYQHSLEGSSALKEAMQELSTEAEFLAAKQEQEQARKEFTSLPEHHE